MTDSPASTLRRAAEKLRGLAQAASPGPWRTHDTYVHDGGYTATVLAGDGNDTRPVAWAPSFSNNPNEIDRQAYPDAIHIAAMHPGVALLLANWLENSVADYPDYSPGVCPQCGEDCCEAVDECSCHWGTAYAVAQAILGEEAAS